MAAFEVIALDTATPQLRAPGASDTYTFPRAVELPLGTANGVLYLNASKVVTSGSALTFDGTTVGLSAGAGNFRVGAAGDTSTHYFRTVDNGGQGFYFGIDNAAGSFFNAGAYGRSIYSEGNYPIQFVVNSAEQMRLTSTGLGIGTSSPLTKFNVESGDILLRGGSMFFGPTAGANGAGRISSELASSVSGSLIFSTLNSSAVMTEAMRLDSSGNLGLGVTPSGWGASKFAMQIGARASLYGASNLTVLGNNYYDNGTNNIYIATAAASDYYQSAGSHVWRTAPSGTAGNAISFSQVMTLTAAGGLNVGATTDPGAGIIRGTGLNGWTSIGDGVVATNRSDGMYLIQQANTAMLFYTNNTERARITSGGNVCINTISELIDSGRKLSVVGGSVAGSFKVASVSEIPVEMWNAATSGDNLFSQFGTEASFTQRGSIDYDRAGGLVRYNTTSDYRAKDIIGPVQNPGATIDSLKVYEGVMKGATRSRPMLIAHEAQEHAPYAVSGVKDEVNEDGTPKFQQMDVSSLVPLLLAEIQSLRSRLAAAGI